MRNSSGENTEEHAITIRLGTEFQQRFQTQWREIAKHSFLTFLRDHERVAMEIAARSISPFTKREEIDWGFEE